MIYEMIPIFRLARFILAQLRNELNGRYFAI
jgi:hypothetical protein